MQAKNNIWICTYCKAVPGLINRSFYSTFNLKGRKVPVENTQGFYVGKEKKTQVREELFMSLLTIYLIWVTHEEPLCFLFIPHVINHLHITIDLMMYFIFMD